MTAREHRLYELDDVDRIGSEICRYAQPLRFVLVAKFAFNVRDKKAAKCFGYELKEYRAYRREAFAKLEEFGRQMSKN